MAITANIAKNVASYHPRTISQYVPGCTYVVDAEGPCRVYLGTPVVAATTTLLSSSAITAAASTVTVNGTADSPYGRAVQIKGDNTTDDAVCTIVGRDYMGQPMRENLTLTGTTAVNGKKAFYWVDSILAGANATTTSSIDLGWQDVLGLPYKTIKILSEELDGVLVSSLGTLVGPILTDPQTATTGDVRGTYNPQSTLNGSAQLYVTAIFDNYVNTSGNGGYFGIAQYNG